MFFGGGGLREGGGLTIFVSQWYVWLGLGCEGVISLWERRQ